LGAPPLLLKAHQLGDSSAEMGGKKFSLKNYFFLTLFYATFQYERYSVFKKLKKKMTPKK
jgi:hypothetical protein